MNHSNHLSAPAPAAWRLLRSDRQPGDYNMALDEALWENFKRRSEAGEQPPPVLRLYGWQPAALSIGYAQRAEREIDFEACRRAGIPWVRRPTGGRAILHENTELTYSLVGSIDDPAFDRGVVASYRKISGALVKGLEKLGVAAEVAGRERRGSEGSNTAACFDAPSAYEVTWQDRKIIGSAQARRANTFLQQGTILMTVDVPRLFEVLNPPARQTRAEAVEQVAARLVSVEEVLGYRVDLETVRAAFEQGFAGHFNVRLVPGEPDEAEQRLTGQLRSAKYANPQWNMERQRPRPAFSPASTDGA